MADNDKIKELLASISLHHDQSAYRELFVTLHGRLKQFAFSILRSQEEAEELVSDLFLKIWEKREKLAGIEQPIFYFYTATKNLAFNRLEALKIISKPAPETWLVQLNSVYFDPEKLMLTEEMIRQVRIAINELPPRCRLIFKLVKEDGLKYREVAELLGLSVKTVEAQMAIALRRLGRCMHLELSPHTTSRLKEKKLLNS
jgi:RNA polymerase sigma-70 factor (ECF subfamily)